MYAAMCLFEGTGLVVQVIGQRGRPETLQDQMQMMMERPMERSSTWRLVHFPDPGISAKQPVHCMRFNSAAHWSSAVRIASNEFCFCCRWLAFRAGHHNGD